MPAREFVSQLRTASVSTFDAILLRPYLDVFGERVSERFTILGNARTGSNYLLDGLKTSASVRMYHEIFAAHNREIGRDFDRILSSLFRKERKGTRFVGFKLFYNHLTPDEWEKFRAHKEFKIIHLTRLNRLRTILSLDIAFRTGQWTRSSRAKDQDPELRRVELDASKLLARIEAIRDQETLARSRFDDRPVLEVVYETMAAQPAETFKRVGDFLGITDIDPSRIPIRRQNPERLDYLIINFSEVWELLRDTEFAGYLD